MSLISIRRPSLVSTNDPLLVSPFISPRHNLDTNEYYFTVKGAAVVLSHSQQTLTRTKSLETVFIDEIEEHLQTMMGNLRLQDRLTVAVQLQSAVPKHTRYLALVAAPSSSSRKECALIGFDFVGKNMSIGVTVPIVPTTQVELDGDGGITVGLLANFFLFKPVSIQSMWLLFQYLHKELEEMNQLQDVKKPEEWLHYYQTEDIATKDPDISCLWHLSLLAEAERGNLCASRASTSSWLDKPQQETEEKIQMALKQIMQTVDLDEVTSGDIRRRLSEQYKMPVKEYKDFIDREMLVILGQLEKPSKIFDYLYLGTEWNASNWEELKKNRVKYILNMTREVDNFFPLHFRYMKIFVSDEANTELLMHWHRTYNFIKQAKDENAAVLVHCKKGISRSSSTVIAYIMKEYGWNLKQALDYVKAKRNCITPNSGFMSQLQTFGGILSASSNRKSQVFNKLSPTRSASDVASHGQKPRKIRSRTSRSICEGYLKAIIGSDSMTVRSNKPLVKQNETKSSPLSEIAKKFGILSLKVRSDPNRRLTKLIPSSSNVQGSYVQTMVGAFEQQKSSPHSLNSTTTLC